MPPPSIFTPPGKFAPQSLVRTSPTADDRLTALERKVAELTATVSGLRADLSRTEARLKGRVPDGFMQVALPGLGKLWLAYRNG